MFGRMAFAAELHQAGIEGEALLSRLYGEFLPDTTREQGDRMARHVLEQIRRFDETRETLLDLAGKPEAEQQALLSGWILGLMEGFTLPSQCRKLHSISQAMDTLDEICRGTCLPEDAGRHPPAGYRGNAGEKGRNAGLRTVVEKLLDSGCAARVQREAEGSLSGLRQGWMDDDLFRAILTISLYTMLAKAQVVPDMPVPIEYVAMEVCCLVSDQEGAVDAAVVKGFLMEVFLSGGTATVMLPGTGAAAYAAYHLTARAIGGLLSSGAAPAG